MGKGGGVSLPRGAPIEQGKRWSRLPILLRISDALDTTVAQFEAWLASKGSQSNVYFEGYATLRSQGARWRAIAEKLGVDGSRNALSRRQGVPKLRKGILERSRRIPGPTFLITPILSGPR